jgi:RNA polymerase sigma factor (sigma-70 family)
MTEEQQIIDLCKNAATRDRGFRMIMSLYQERLYRHIYRMLSNHEDTNDVLQNTFIKAFKNIETFEMRSGIYSWLYRIATNEAISFIRKNKNLKKHSGLEGHDNLVSSNTSDYNLSGDEIMHKLSLATASLPPQQQLIFELRYFDNLSYAEIAERLGLTVGGLKASYHLAVKKIEKYL